MGKTFTDKSVKRIAAAVRSVEAMPQPIRRGHDILTERNYFFPRVCKLKASDAPLAEGSVGTFIIWSGTPGSESSTGVEFEACARFGEVPDDEVFCMALHNGYGWYAIVRGCTEEEMGG